MLGDGRDIPTGEVIDTDVCIIGAGPAGISMAREFIGRGIRVCVLEGGGADLEPEMLELTKGESVGRHYFPLFETRARAFGGSSRFWGESFRSRPLDPIDFEARDAVPYSGWPFDRAHLDPFYERAYEVCSIASADFEMEKWEEMEGPRLPLIGDDVSTTLFRLSDRVGIFPSYLSELK